VTDAPLADGTGDIHRGRGLVIAGGILAGLYVIITVVLFAWFAQGLATGGETALSMVFPFWLIGWLAFTPLWLAGIGMLGIGRSRQRGPVRASVVAWIIALGSVPLIPVILSGLMSVLSSGLDVSTEGAASTVAFAILVASIVLMPLIALAAGAWLTWGAPQRALASD